MCSFPKLGLVWATLKYVQRNKPKPRVFEPDDLAKAGLTRMSGAAVRPIAVLVQQQNAKSA
ncbi:hypothetical protein RCCS2_08004 [Roseobacter sp. CCS2]|nr:hypothetical protein RCCS2_08004 [Roseobacter sp. CCS2]